MRGMKRLRHVVQTALLLLAGAIIVRADAQEWRVVSETNGVRLEAREVDGERFDELRVATSHAPPETVAEYLGGRYLDEKNPNITRTFIRRSGTITIWSDILRTPIIRDRCYAMRFERQDLGDGAIRVRFSTSDYVGPAPLGCVALHARGEWVLTPIAVGTRITYASLTDIGGKIPAALSRRTLADAAVLNVRKVVAGASGLPLPRGIGDP